MLSGGVSCDVFRVDLAQGPVCVKRALPRLRVAAEWNAPVERNHLEVEWLRFAVGVDPGLVPEVLGEDREAHLFAMTYLEPAYYPCWKTLLMEGAVELEFAAAVGAALARFHGASADSASVGARFDRRDLFRALRIEPYLLHTAKAHSDLAPRIQGLAYDVETAQIALMHGDVSPKNILRGPRGPVFLDAETACYGDPAFDLAFCLNHLLLKCVYAPAHMEGYCDSFDALRHAYLSGASWERPEVLDARAAALLSALILARIDGKSPAEYLVTERDRDFVRAAARAYIGWNEITLDRILADWRQRLVAR